MKKLLIILTICLLVSGCGDKQIVCTSTKKVDETKVTIEISAPIKDNKVTDIKTKVINYFNTKEAAKAYCKNIKSSSNSKIKCDGKKVIITNTSNSNQSSNKDDFIKSAEKEGFKCK